MLTSKIYHIDTRVSHEENKRIRAVVQSGRLSEIIRTFLLLYVEDRRVAGGMRDIVHKEIQSNITKP